MQWIVEKFLKFEGSDKQKPRDGYVQFGFHTASGNLYAIDNEQHWVGLVNHEGALSWTAGPNVVVASVPHLHVELEEPHYVCDAPDGSILVASSGNCRVYKLDRLTNMASLLIDGHSLGITFLGNSVVDMHGNIRVNEVKGCKIHKFSSWGELLLTFGNGVPGFQPGTVAREDAQFNWVYDLRLGPDGNIYVLDSRNYAVRVIDTVRETVTTVAGTGSGGYDGDGGEPISATFGSNPNTYFDGPWSLSLDEHGNIYVGDTWNRAIRVITADRTSIKTLAGSSDGLDLYHICGLDYYAGQLFIPLWDGELVVLRHGKYSARHPTEVPLK
ncbi:MAG: NHL repeat-containing protein [Selenomonadales bacterium]|nr:NHL repeat-containing protein [Selenomonadales bacterium]